ncbi:MAG: TonB-dependent receptor [Bacteroidales bacterium]|nr:TonB-dependent receptor [Bacteroidales bacterium]
MKKIIIAAAMAAASLSYAPEAAMAQTAAHAPANTVKVTVLDEQGEPLIGAAVKVKGEKTAVTTDLDGQCYLPSSAEVLEISYIGYKPATVQVAGQKEVQVEMQPTSNTLDEMVVVGYTTAKKESLTSAITQIKGDDVYKGRGNTNTTVALQGAVAGLTVTRTSTRPGNEGASIQIRGDVSINGSEPLILIDGVSASLDEFNGLNGNDIESISVLKDASAAIYGARSAGGVILVTTKRGKEGKATVTYSGSYSRTIKGIQTPITNNQEWLQMFYEAQYNDAAAGNSSLKTPEEIHNAINWWVFSGDVSGVTDDGTTLVGESMWNALMAGEPFTVTKGNKVQRFVPGNSFLDYLYDDADSWKHDVSVSGGGKNFNYRASLFYSDSNSQLAIAEDGEKKYGGRINAGIQVNDHLNIETGVSYEQRKITSPSQGVGQGWMDQWFWAFENENGDPYDTFNGARNPVGLLKNGGQDKILYTTLRATGQATYDLGTWVPGLKLRGNASYREMGRDETLEKNPVYWYDWVGTLMGSATKPGSLEESHKTWKNYTLGGFLLYNRQFADVHNVDVMLGVTAEREDYKAVTASRNNGPLYEGSGLVDLNVWNSGTNNGASGGQTQWGLVSYVGDLRYNYAQRYLVEFLMRRDGSSKLSKSQRWKNFWSISGGWVISNESFMRPFSPFLTNLKVRYNYGKTGNVSGINDYERYASVASGSVLFGNAMQTSLWLDGMTSDSRTWETINTHNAGVDFGFFNQRLTGSFDWFDKTNDGMFIEVVYPSVLGADAPKTNNGKLRTRGWEVELTWRDHIGDFNYYVGGQLSDAWTKLLELTNNENVPNPGNNQYRIVGKPLNAIYVYQTDGVFQTQEEVDAYYEMYYWNADHSGPKANNILPAPATDGTYRLRPGARKLVDLNGDGAITTDDLYYAGDKSPRLTFGFKLGFDWKGFDVGAFFQGVWKQTLLRTGNFYAPFVVNYTSQNKTFLGKTWSEDNPTNDYCILSRDNNFNKFNYENKDVSVTNNRYIRLKNLVVGYTLPQAVTRYVGVEKFRVYFSGDDLWEWTKVKDGYDPEYGEASNNTFPFSRLLTFGVELTF